MIQTPRENAMELIRLRDNPSFLVIEIEKKLQEYDDRIDLLINNMNVIEAQKEEYKKELEEQAKQQREKIKQIIMQDIPYVSMMREIESEINKWVK